MPFNTPQISPPPLADPWVDEDGVPVSDLINWILITLLPAIAQSPSVFNSTSPPFEEEDDDAIALTPLPIGDLSTGLYRVSVFIRVTSPDGAASSVAPVVSFPNDAVTCSMTGDPALTSDDISIPGTWTFFLEVDAPGPISIGTVYASTTPNLMSYKIVATVERVN